MPPRNQFPARVAGASPREFFAITPDDDVDLPQMPQAIWVGVSGDIAVMGADGNDEVFTNVPVGYFICSPTRVLATGTDAEDLVGVV